MTKQLFDDIHPKTIRLLHIRFFNLADELLAQEEKLIHALYELYKIKTFKRLGHKSLLGFCVQSLKLPRTQSQRLVTKVSRFDPRLSSGRLDLIKDANQARLGGGVNQ